MLHNSKYYIYFKFSFSTIIQISQSSKNVMYIPKTNSGGSFEKRKQNHCLCLFAHNGFQHILCCVFVLFFFISCTLCCQFLWIVHFWLPIRYSLTFTYNKFFSPYIHLENGFYSNLIWGDKMCKILLYI